MKDFSPIDLALVLMIAASALLAGCAANRSGNLTPAMDAVAVQILKGQANGAN